MKNILLILPFVLLAAGAIQAQAQTVSSIYQSLAGRQCKHTSVVESGYGFDLCKGVGGYTLELSDADQQNSIKLIAPDKKSFNLQFESEESLKMSRLERKIEWRVIREGRKIVPIALITRFEVLESKEPNKRVSYLMVSKITADSACLIDIVKPSAAANEEARRLADASANKPCYSFEK
jgi:hypothetical protein